MPSSRGFGAVALAIMLVAGRVHAQPSTENQLICPLSEEQQEESQNTWAVLATVFKHDRCSNCHGKQTPFSEGTSHDVFKIEVDDNGDPETEAARKKTFLVCPSCHENVPLPFHWATPPADQQWWNQSVDELCRTQHEQRKIPFQFIGHVNNDALIQEAFTGLMALNEDAQDIVEPPYPKPPPPMGYGEFLAHVDAWIEAQGLTETSARWQGDEVDCGCVPLKYEIELDTILPAGVVPQCSAEARMNETVPITFTAENRYEGTATGTYAVSNFSCITGCTAVYRTATTDVELTGEVVTNADKEPVDLKVTVKRTVQPTSFDITCPCDEGSDCPYPITFQVPGIPTETYELPPLDATLGTWTRAGPYGTVTIIVRKRE
jgi:hypothetical protein